METGIADQKPNKKSFLLALFYEFLGTALMTAGYLFSEYTIVGQF